MNAIGFLYHSKYKNKKAKVDTPAFWAIASPKPYPMKKCKL